MHLGLHHIQLRKRVAAGLEPYPARGLTRRFFDYAMYGVGLIQPVALLPQIGSIYINHETAGVSLLSWELFTLFSGLWAAYGFIHRDKLIAVAYTLVTILDAVVVIGVLMY